MLLSLVMGCWPPGISPKRRPPVNHLHLSDLRDEKQWILNNLSSSETAPASIPNSGLGTRSVVEGFRSKTPVWERGCLTSLPPFQSAESANGLFNNKSPEINPQKIYKGLFKEARFPAEPKVKTFRNSGGDSLIPYSADEAMRVVKPFCV